MKILAIDSTAVTASVAVSDGEELLAEFTINNGNTHSETLLPMVEAALKLLGSDAGDIDIFACSAGPGSFTGVRIGAATVKGLAFDRNKPCIGVSTLEALAFNLVGSPGIICPVMNARRSQVYTALFRTDGEKLERLLDDCVISLSELGEKLKEFSAQPVRFCGDGYDIAFPVLRGENVLDTPVRYRFQSAFSVSQVAMRMFLGGVRTTDAELVPTYLRLSQAERERLEKNKM